MSPPTESNDRNFWGPPIWNYLHVSTFMYPDQPTTEDKTKMKQLFDVVTANLPCATCREHFSKAISSLDKYLGSKNDLTRFLVDVHNQVNLRLKKAPKSYEEVLLKYKATCSNTSCPAILSSGEMAEKRGQTPPKDIAPLVAWMVLALAFIFSVLCIRRHSSSSS